MGTDTVTHSSYLYTLSTWSHEGGPAVTVHTGIEDAIDTLEELLSLVQETARGHRRACPRDVVHEHRHGDGDG